MSPTSTPTNNTLQVTPVRHRSKAAPYMPSYMEDGQSCAVCGDLATGLHYRAITCEGCKGFFRRTAQRHLHYSCKASETCEINKQTRNVCQRCRYLKCLTVGMSADLVLNESERVQKRDLIRENRERRRLEQQVTQLKNSPPRAEQQNSLLHKEINRITKAYCKFIDCHKSANAADASSEEMIRNVVVRSKQFAEQFPCWETLSCEAQWQLLQASALQVSLIRLLSLYDERDNCFQPTDDVVLTEQQLLDLAGDANEEVRELVSSLFRLARGLAAFQLDDRQLAILSALIIFDSYNVQPSQSTEVFESTQNRLWELLRVLHDESCDSVSINRWPRLLSRMMQLRLVANELAAHFAPRNASLFAALLKV